MTALDAKYLSEVVLLAQGGDSNAFAEIYAATYRKQYAFALGYLGNEISAQDALQTAYINALNGLTALDDGSMVVAWLTLFNFDICSRLRCDAEGRDANLISVKVKGTEYKLGRLKRLTTSESAAAILRYHCGFSKGQIASLLEIKRSAVRRYLRSARLNLSEGV